MGGGGGLTSSSGPTASEAPRLNEHERVPGKLPTPGLPCKHRTSSARPLHSRPSCKTPFPWVRVLPLHMVPVSSLPLGAPFWLWLCTQHTACAQVSRHARLSHRGTPHGRPQSASERAWWRGQGYVQGRVPGRLPGSALMVLAQCSVSQGGPWGSGPGGCPSSGPWVRGCPRQGRALHIVQGQEC